MKQRSLLPHLALAALLAGGITTSAQAVIKTWAGADGTAWTNASNWSSPGQPAEADQVLFGNLPPDAPQTATLSGDIKLGYLSSNTTNAAQYTLLFDGGGNRSYTVSGGVLDFSGNSTGTYYQRLRLSASGTGSVTIGSEIKVTGGGIFRIEGDGERVLNLNGNLTGNGKIMHVDAAKARIHFRGTNTGFGSLYLYGGELVTHHSASLGTEDIRVYGKSTIALASNLTLAGVRLYENLEVRNREEAPSNLDRTVTFSSRILESGTLQVVDNINSTGRTIVQLKGNGSGSSRYQNSFSMVSSGVLQFAQPGQIDIGLAADATSSGSGFISGAGSVEITGTGNVRLGSASTYTGKTTITSGTLALTSGGSVANTSTIALASTGVFSIANLTASSYALNESQTLTGNGTVNTTAKTLQIKGTLSPGHEGATGALTFQTGALATAGSVVWESTAETILRLDSLVLFDQLKFVGGTVSAKSTLQLGGELVLLTDTDYDWVEGDSLQLFDWSATTTSVSGFFSNIDGISISENLAWDVSALHLTGMVHVIAVPEPTLGLTLAGAGLLFWRWNRRNRHNRRA